MAILNFPSSPANGDQYTLNNVIYTWDNTQEKWTANNAQDLDARFVNVTGDTMTGNLTVPSLNQGPPAFRNAIINGSMQIWQRSTDNSASDSGYHAADRWKRQNAVGNEATRLRRIDSPYPGFAYALRITSTDNTNIRLRHAIELDGAGASGRFTGTWTLSFYCSAALSDAQVGIAFADDSNRGNAANWDQQSVVSLGNDRYSVTATAVTPESTNECVLISFTPQGTDWNITGVQFEPGPVCTPVEVRPLQQELALCQRYFQRLFLQGGIVVLKSDADRTTRTPQRLSVKMRATPDAENFIQDQAAVATKEDGTQTTKTAPSAVSPRADDLIEVNNTAQSLSTVRYIGASVDLNAEL